MVWLVLVIAAIVALLAVPVRGRAELYGEGRPEWRVEAVWLGGLVSAGSDAGGAWGRVAGVRKALARGGKEGAADREKGHKGGLIARWRASTPAERRALARLMRAVWAALDFAARGAFRFGCEDPATTAWLHAAYCLAQATGRFAELTAEADFTLAGWRGWAEVSCSLRPIRLAAPGLRFLLAIAGGRIKTYMTGGRKRWQAQT